MLYCVHLYCLVINRADFFPLWRDLSHHREEWSGWMRMSKDTKILFCETKSWKASAKWSQDSSREQATWERWAQGVCWAQRGLTSWVYANEVKGKNHSGEGLSSLEERASEPTDFSIAWPRGPCCYSDHGASAGGRDENSWHTVAFEPCLSLVPVTHSTGREAHLTLLIPISEAVTLILGKGQWPLSCFLQKAGSGYY